MARKGKLFALGYGAALFAFTLWLALDTFVIPHVYAAVLPVATAQAEPTVQAETAIQTETMAQAETAAQAESAQGLRSSGKGKRSRGQGEVSGAEEPQTAETAAESSVYDDGDTRVALTTYRVNDTTVYVADVTLSSPEALCAILAQNAYGRNVTETPSSMAERSGAVLAVNGDFYGARETGYVIRNGALYRASAISGQEDLVIDADGNFSIIREDQVSAQALVDGGARQVFSFGPALVENGQVSVSPQDEVGQAMASNPRTAIAQVGELHYLFVVADGRTSESAGLSLYEMAQFLQSLGAETAYNLDGGGSSAMIFQGQLVNIPTTSGHGSKERSVSDIVGIF